MIPGKAPIEYMFMDMIPEDKLKRNHDGSVLNLSQLLCKRGKDCRSIKTNCMQLAMVMFRHAATATKDKKANHPDWETDPEYQPTRFEIELSGTIYSEINMNQKRMSQLVLFPSSPSPQYSHKLKTSYYPDRKTDYLFLLFE